MFQQHQRPSSIIGSVISLIGAGIAAIAFLVFPYISLGIFGSYTAIQLANGIYGFSVPSLWLEILAALSIMGLALFAVLKKSPVAPAIVILLLSGLSLLVLLVIYGQQSSQDVLFTTPLTSFYASGFWFYLIGIVVALTGGILQLSTGRPPQQQIHSQQPGWPLQPPYEQ